MKEIIIIQVSLYDFHFIVYKNSWSNICKDSQKQKLSTLKISTIQYMIISKYTSHKVTILDLAVQVC